MRNSTKATSSAGSFRAPSYAFVAHLFREHYERIFLVRFTLCEKELLVYGTSKVIIIISITIFVQSILRLRV